MSSKFCCIVPAYNEEKRIGEVIAGVREAIPDIIVVDNGSQDATAALAEQAGAYVIRHGQNCGKGMALRTGFSHALKQEYDAVMTVDGDGHHAPSEIADFLAAFASGRGDII